MIFREAVKADIPGIQVVRNAVKENRLSNPALVTNDNCGDYIRNRGKGWICEIDSAIVGFAIVSVTDHNVWALFVHPDHEGKNIGRKLHDDMLDWYFNQTDISVWLSTAPGTRAETFYRKAGWQQTGITKSGEIKFEMTAEDWKRLVSCE